MAGINALDDFFNGLVFDEEVAYLDGREDLAYEVGGGDFQPVEADAVGELVHLLDFEAVAAKQGDAGGLGAIFQDELDLFRAEEALLEIGERPIVKDAAVVNDHDAAAELFDVVEIVSGEKDGGAELAVDGAEELADVIFGDDVEADGGLVEEEERGIVEERGGEVAAHAFAEREFAHGRVEIIADGENFIEALHAGFEIALGNVVDAAEQLEGFDDGDVPPKLGALAENDADGFDVLAPLAIGDVAVDADFAARRDEDASEHFNAGGFSGAVGADVADHFAAVDGEGDAVYGRDGFVITDEEILNRAPNAFAAVEGAEVFAEIVDADDGIGGHERPILTSASGALRISRILEKRCPCPWRTRAGLRDPPYSTHAKSLAKNFDEDALRA